MSLSAYFDAVAVPRESVLSRYSDLLLVAGVVAILALMVLPLPLLVIDLLVAVNLCLGVVLLLMAIYIRGPLDFSVFPAVLLISTLFRLSLGIATTRMILLHGDGGHIIATFGKTVAGGNLVVGLVVFLIITVVQFIVIAKGAERVAEVSARFTLDAMPGKQMAIDADLRAGMLDKDEARRKRLDLERESKLHGSLDGAMKFVKGDAIAGIVIIVINLLGGLAVGMMQQGLDFHHAMVKYSILTIGDGMVSQIPALLGAMSAGLIVTRGSDESDRHLGDAMRKQFTAHARVPLVAGFICCLLAPVPGFPGGVFLCLGLALLLGGALISPALRQRLGRASGPRFEALIKRLEEAPGASMAAQVPAPRPAVPLLMQVGTRSLAPAQLPALTAELEKLLAHFQLNLGLGLPRIGVHAEEGTSGWKLLVSEVPVAQGAVPAEQPVAQLAEAARAALRRHAGLFMGIQEASVFMAQGARDFPDTSKEVLRLMPIQRVAEVLRRLVEEEVPLRHVRDLLEALADVGQREKDVATIVEFVRIALKRHLAWRHAPAGELRAVLVKPDVEDLLRRSLQTSGGQQQLALEPALARGLADTVAASVRQHGAGAVVCAVDVRRHLRKLLEADLFETPVLSYHELHPSLRLDIVDRVGQAPAALGAA